MGDIPEFLSSLYTSTKNASSRLGWKAIAHDWKYFKAICLDSALVVCRSARATVEALGADWGLDDPRHLVHELLARYLAEKVVASVLDTCIDKLDPSAAPLATNTPDSPL
jgi:hypothetical protein